MRNSIISLKLRTEPEFKCLLVHQVCEGKVRKHSNLLQKRHRQLKNAWQKDMAELQQLADLNDTKGFYQSMHVIWGPRVNHPDQLLASDNSTLLTEKQDLLDTFESSD